MINTNGVSLRQDIKEVIFESPMTDMELKANRILPIITTPQSSGKVPTIPAGEGKRGEDGKRAPKGKYSRIEWTTNEESYETHELGFESPVDMVTEAEFSDYYSEEMVSGEIARNTLWVAREKEVSDAVFNNTTFASGNDVQAVSQNWNNADSSLPTVFTDIDNAVEKVRAKIGIPRYQLSVILTDRAVRYGIRTDAVKDDVKYTNDILTKSREQQLQFLADFLHVKEVIEVSSLENTKELGITAEFDNIWSTSFGMVAKLSPSINSWKVGGLGRQPAWSKITSDYIMESYFEKQINGTVLRARDYKGQKVFKKFGCLLTGVIV